MSSAGPAPRTLRTGMVPVGIALSVTLFMVVLLGWSPTLNPLDVLTGAGFRTEVPDVVGMTQTKAHLALDDRHLEGRTEFAASLTVERGVVISQRPPAGDKVERGETVTIVVSRGKSLVETPDVIGRTESEATASIRNLGLTVRIETRNHEEVPKGSVIRQTPVPGEVVIGGAEVILEVSLGPATRTVPDVTQMPLEGALYTLGRAGFTLGRVTTLDDPKLPANSVISTNPGEGEIRDRDTPVDIVVSNGPAPVTLPNYVGKSFDEAATSLAGLGLIPAEKAEQVGADDPSVNVVTGQNPAAGTPIRPGQVVTLSVKRGG
jgi:beta-lactam-binding protein with PASTA domain